MLKKAIALCLAAGCIFCVGLLPSLILGTAPKVQVVTPQVTEYLPTVRCSGTVRTESSYDLVSAGIYQVAETYGQAGQLTAALRWPIWLVYLSVPVGGALILIHLVEVFMSEVLGIYTIEE